MSTSASIRSTREAPAADEPSAQLLTFDVAGRRYACPMSTVREIVSERPVTRLPGASAAVRGLMNLRGTLLTVLDVAVHLAVREEAGSGGHVLVVEAGGRLGGCAVDAVRSVHRVPAEPVGNADGGAVVMGFEEIGGEQVPLLDLPLLVRQALLFPGER